MNPQSEPSFQEDEAPQYSERARRICWAIAAVMVFLHTLPAAINAPRMLRTTFMMLSARAITDQLILSLEAATGIVAFIKLVRLKPWGLLLALFITAHRITYCGFIFIYHGNHFLENLVIIPLMFSVLTLIVLLLPPLRDHFDLSASRAWSAIAIGAACGTALYWTTYHNH